MNILRYAGVVSLVMMSLAAVRADSGDTPFRHHDADAPESFAAVGTSLVFDVVDASSDYWMIQFEASPGVAVEPKLVRLAPGDRHPVRLHLDPGADAATLTYALARSTRQFVSHANRYRAYSDGETEACIPVDATGYDALRARTERILQQSMTPLADPGMPPNTEIYTAGPFYKAAGLFGRDFLFQLEGSGREFVSAESIRSAVDYQASKQLMANRKLGAFTYPRGAIPDHIYPDGRFCWGPGLYYGDDTAHFHRPSMDEAFCFVILGWHYGYKAGWNDRWRKWFGGKAQRFSAAWNSVPLNPRTGLVTQWSTPGHVGASGITETNGSSVTWGFHDSYGFGGDDIGCSILACNAARAIADMFGHAGDPMECEKWAKVAAGMQASVQAQFDSRGFLPWGLGANAPTMASPDYTGYAIWSGMLTEAQADRASDWFAERYLADRAAGGAADMFNLAPPFRGAVRMARKADDVSPGRHVWPDMRDGNNWENLAFGYNRYQDGGYWYYQSLGIAIVLARNHPELAREWVGNAYADLNSSDPNPPYERIDGLTPVNSRYNASAAQLFGMGVPATVAVIKVSRGNARIPGPL